MPKDLIPKNKRTVNHLISLAEKHGEESEPEHQIGDLEAYFGVAFKLLTPEQREAFFADDTVRETVRGALCLDEDDE